MAGMTSDGVHAVITPWVGYAMTALTVGMAMGCNTRSEALALLITGLISLFCIVLALLLDVRTLRHDRT